MHIDLIVANNIKKHRQNINITQAQLAELTNLSVGMIAAIETCKSCPSIPSIQKIADALNIRPYELFLAPEDIKPFNEEQLTKILSEEIYSLTKNFQMNLAETFLKYKK